MKKTIITIIAVATAIVFSARLLAQESGIHLNKTVSFDYASQSGTITMESFVEGETHVVIEELPTDIVLVMDVSSSMLDPLKSSPVLGGNEDLDTDGLDKSKPEEYYSATVGSLGEAYRPVRYSASDNEWQYHNNTLDKWHSIKESTWKIRVYQSKLGMMMSAAENFINTMKNEAVSKNVAHKISIVSFSTNNYSSKQTRIVVQPTDIRSGSDALIQGVYTLITGGVTASDYGLKLASDILDDIPVGRDSYRAVVLFTDGDPSHGLLFDKDIANKAIECARGMKEGKSANIYSIGVFDSAPDEDSNSHLYMEGVSSNYPHAISLKSLGEKMGEGYYAPATSTEALQTFLDRIQREISKGGSKVNIGQSAVIEDVLTSSFMLPEGTDTEDIKVYTSRFISYDEASGTYTFDNTRTGFTAGIELSKDITGCDVISVTGFNYKEYWCGPGHENYGRKLIICIPFVPSAILPGGNIATNKNVSGLFDEKGGKLHERFPVPALKLHDITVSRSGLESGESAVYELISGDKVLARFALTGENTGGDVRIKLKNVPEGRYTVRETSWNWAYDKSAESLTQDVLSDSYFYFSGAHKRPVQLHDETIKSGSTAMNPG